MDQNGPFRPKWTKMVHFGLPNANIRFGIDHFGPFWSSTLSDSTVASPYKRRNDLDPKCTRNGPKSSSLGWAGGGCRDWGGGAVREKENSCSILLTLGLNLGTSMTL